MAVPTGYLRGRPPRRNQTATRAEDFVFGSGAVRSARRSESPRIARITLRRMLGTIAGAGVLTATLVLATPMIAMLLGYRTYVLAGDSMAPTARVGDAVLLEMVEGDGVRVGDLITYRPLRSDTITTHRVLSRHTVAGRLHFRTKGDANETQDPELVPASNVVGRVALRITDVGSLYTFATTPAGRILLVVVPALVLVAGEVRRLRPRRPRIPPNVVPLDRTNRGRRRAATVSMAALLALAFAGPASGAFVEAMSVGSNAFSTGNINAPTLDSATSGPVGVQCRVDLAWTAPATGLAPDGYDVYRSTTSGGPYSFIEHVGAVTSTSDTDPALNALTTYYYVLQSSLQNWRSGNSNQRSVTTGVCL